MSASMSTPARQSNQSTQYNEIASAYSVIYPSDGSPSSLDCGLFEEVQFKSALTSPGVSLQGARVLELACGGGFYSTRYLAWGARAVVGVDISASMVEVAAANARSQGIHEDKLWFMVGDATDETLRVDADGELFDVVACAWLLNYAGDAQTMTKMWDVMARHLKPGGHVVALTIPPLVTPGRCRGAEMEKDALEAERKLLDAVLAPEGAWGQVGNRGRVVGTVAEGLKMETELGFKERGDALAVFENYHLGMEYFDRAIKACMLDGKPAFEGLEWQNTVITEDLKKGRPVGYWNGMTVWPLCRTCIARRTR